jgi:hypothetical protein
MYCDLHIVCDFIILFDRNIELLSVGSHGCDCMVVGFTTTCTISTYYQVWAVMVVIVWYTTIKYKSYLIKNVCQKYDKFM